ncbi:hypothetical protein BRD06_04070 [Halobacteriales archaeon QS_9_67_15]|nr:MAG: hypothetical protein BRD06_04070 [Halobacteriales archaeon QS_9_67_15]
MDANSSQAVPSRLVDAVRRPEYTGANRCWPCTALNGVLLGVAAVAVGTVSVSLAVATAAVGAGTLAGEDGSDPEVVLETLIEGGVLAAEGPELSLSESFETAWDEEVDALLDASGEELAAAAATAAPGTPETTVHEVDGDQVVQLGSGGSVMDEDEALLSRPVVVAEVAAVRALTAADVKFDAAARATAANALRAFLDDCPVCGTALVESSTADCCGGQKGDPQPVSRCPDCETAIYTFPTA